MPATYPETPVLNAVISIPDAAISLGRRWIGSPITVKGLPLTFLT
jgi:hypothetical protein